jgi:cbb3-type cytochrome oxidase subunit 3
MKSISDVVGAAGLHAYAEIALVIFLAVFVAVVLRVLAARGAELDRAARLPLDDDAPNHLNRPGANDS